MSVLKSPNNHPGLLISFDGVDSSGKETQTKNLVQRLRTAGHTVHTFQTPDYTTPSGQALKKMLQDPVAWQARPWTEKIRYFADNRAEHKEEVMSALNHGDIVIYDRYVPSSLAFVAVEAFAQGVGEEQRQRVQREVSRYEYETNQMPVENLAIFLDVPPTEAARLLHSRKTKLQDKDEYTDHLDVQNRLYREYELLIEHNLDHYLRVPCVADGSLRSIEDIAETIWQSILTRFPLAKS